MGLKGISWFEQNVEKVVAGVFGVALLGVVAMQFIGDGSTIELGMGKERKRYGYDQVWDQVAQQARATKSLISSVEPDTASIPETPKVLSTFTGKLRGPVAASKDNLAAVWDRPSLERIGILKGDDNKGPVKTETYAALKVPAAGKPVAATYLATIHPEEVRASEDLAKLLLGASFNVNDPAAFKPGEMLPKLDHAAVSVETMFNGANLEAILLGDPDDSGPASPMPRHWWDSDNIQVLGLELERQELNSKGEWGATAKVPHMPGRVDLVSSVKEAVESEGGGFRDIMTTARSQREQVLRPAYYSIVLGEEWAPPSEVAEEQAAGAAAPVGGDRVTRLKRQYESKTDELTTLDRKIKTAEDEAGQQPGSPRPRVEQPRPGGPGGKGGSPSGNNPSGDRPETKDPKQAALERLKGVYAKKYSEREKIAEEIRRLGAEVPGEPVAVAAPTAPKTNTPEPPLLTNPEARLWTHDVTVQRGKTYRYRVTVVLNNPIYGKNAALDPKQADLAKEPLVRSAASEWSEPVRVDPETFYFITSASPEDAFASAARASAEVFVFSMGYWRKGQVNLEPGDTIAADVKVPDPEKIGAMLAGDPNQPQPPAPPAGPGGPRGLPPAPDGGRGERGERGHQPLPPAPPPNGEAPVVDPSTILVPRMVAEDAMLLDVASTTVVSEQGIAKTKTENQAFLLDVEGLIVVRTPDGDRNAGAYLRLLRSVERGEEALKPRALRPLEAPRTPNQPNEPKGTKPAGDGGGGG